jgi:membrane-associated phospholipid phosphatase
MGRGWDSRIRYGLSGVIMALVTVDILLDGPLRHLDHHVHRFCDSHVRGLELRMVETIALIGQRGYVLLVIVLLAVVAGIRARSWRHPLVSALIVIALSILQVALKSVIPRSFPAGDRDVLFVDGDAYPSGHTLNAFLLVWVALELLVVAFPAARRRLPPRRRHTIALVTGGVAGAALVLADKHWLTDVLFSLALGPLLLHRLVAAAPFTRR